MIERVNAKLLIGSTNALSISSNKAIKELDEIVSRFKTNTNIKDLKFHIHTKNIDSFVRSWKS